MDKRNTAAFFIDSLNPNELPITKQSRLAPLTAMEPIFSASCSEESIFPSIQRAIKGEFPTEETILSASICRAASICAREGVSGRRLSGSSKIENRQKAESRFAYSAQASRQ